MDTHHKITVSAKIVSPFGETLFHSSQEATIESVGTDARALFNSLVPPMERVLTEATRKFTAPTSPSHE